MICTGADTFGELLNAFRKRERFTQQQLAEAIGMHRHAISRWEQGEVLPASKAIVLELARHLHLNDQEARELLEASLIAPTPLWGVPFPRNPFFTGRQETLETLHRHLRVEQAVTGPQVYALCGLGGVGKTQTMLEYAYRYALEYNAIFWIEAETLERVLFSLQRISKLLRLSEQAEMDQQQVVEAVQHWLATHDRWLLIWDNLEDLELPHRIFSPTRQGALLFTTRRQSLGTLARRIELLPMGHEEGSLFLLRRANLLEPEATSEQVHKLAVSMPAEYVATSELVTILGGLPLALDQAGAYLEETGCSLTDYLRRYEQQRVYLLDRRGGSGGDHPYSVTATFQLVKEQVEQEQKGAADLLCLCAFLHPESIPEDLFSIGSEHLGSTLAPIAADPVRFDLALAALRNLSLVQRQPQTHTLSLHRLVQAVLRDQMEPTDTRLWSKRAVRMVNAAFPEGAFGTWAQCERCLPQVLACIPLIGSVESDLPEAGELVYKAGSYLVACGRYKEAEPLLERAAALGEQQHGTDHSALIPRLEKRAELFWRRGKYEHAEPLYLRVLRLEEQHLEPTHPKTAETLNNLAALYWTQGKYEEAEPLYRRALQVQEQQLGPEHPEVAITTANLASLYRDQGKYGKAEPLYRRALQIGEQRLGPKHPDTVYPLHGLASMYRDQGKYEEAKRLYQQVLAIRDQLLGSAHPDTAETISGLASVYRDQGKYKAAVPLYQQALAISEQRLGSTHPKTMKLLADYSRLLE